MLFLNSPTPVDVNTVSTNDEVSFVLYCGEKPFLNINRGAPWN